MFLRPEKVDPKQQALDNVLMQLVHHKMTARPEPRKNLKPSYPPARNGATNFEPTFDPKPVSRKGGAANPGIMQALKAYMNKVQTPARIMNPEQAPPGMFDADAPLDTSQVEDRRGQEFSTGYMRGPLSRTQGKGFGDKTDALHEDGGFDPRMELIRKLMAGMGR